MTEDVPKMAFHASQQYQQYWSNIMTTLSRITVDTISHADVESGDKPIWLVAIDYTTLGSLILVVFASFTLLAYAAFKAWQGGAIKLDQATLTEDKSISITRKEALAEALLENMDHTLHDDGEAVDSAKFWRQVRHSYSDWFPSLINRYDGTKLSS